MSTTNTLATIQQRAKRIGQLRDKQSKIEAAAAVKLAPIKEELAVLEELQRDEMLAAGVPSIRTNAGTMSAFKSEQPTVVDWEKLDAWAIKHKAVDIYQRRITAIAIKDRRDDGEKIPGIEWNEVRHFKFTKAKS